MSPVATVIVVDAAEVEAAEKAVDDVKVAVGAKAVEVVKVTVDAKVVAVVRAVEEDAVKVRALSSAKFVHINSV